VEGVFGGVDGDGCRAVVRGRVALTEVVGLDFVVEGADLFLRCISIPIASKQRKKVSESYPVDFIEIIRLQDGSADDASTIGSAHLHLDITEENIEFGLNRRGIALLADGEQGTEVGARHRSRGCIPAIERGVTGGEVGAESVRCEAGVRVAGG
jgi:hypothetical protein